MFSCIYAGWVRHRRLEKSDHAFRNRIYLMYLDLAELDQVFAGRWFWSTRRIAPFRFHRADHFGDPGESLAESVRREILTQTGETFQGSIRLLTQLRHFGFVFNPVSFYYCFAAPTATEPDFVVAEVNNTPWGQRHCYVLRPAEFSRKLTAAEAVTKVFHVSPFMDMAMDYHWHVPPPGARLSVDIANRRAGQTIFDVTMQLERRPVDTLNLARIMLAFPFSTFRVFAQIYWQALRLWWKRVPFVPHPAKGQPHGNQKLGQGSPHRQLSERTKLSAARQMRETSSPRVDAPAESLSSRTEPRPPVNIP
ncbi:MAG: DUF1365 domain-containing protein [Planctomycetota bacterium]